MSGSSDQSVGNGTWYALATGQGANGMLDLTRRDLGAQIATPWRRAAGDEPVTLTAPVTEFYGVVSAAADGGPPNRFFHITKRLHTGDTFTFRPSELPKGGAS